MSVFETTHWSRVLAAGSESTGRSREALAALCESYWYPLYAHLRHGGHSVEDAEDLTQGFFARVIEKGVVLAADPERGRFRSFLLASLRNYVANQRDHAWALKRGGATPTLSLDLETAERRYGDEPRDSATPGTVFDRRWALTMIQRVLAELRAESRRRGKAEVYDVLKPHLVGTDRDLSYGEIGEKLGMSETAARVATHRLRRRFAQLVRKEIAQTVATPEAVEDEIRYLLQVMAR